MVLFRNDYQAGCIPEILEALSQTNMEQTPGYGCDDYCRRAAELIRNRCNLEAADVYFMVGGTQTNATVISSILRPFQGVLCADTGHIAVHETGAIEHGGHKVLTLPSRNGLIDALEIDKAMCAHYHQDSPFHEVQPGMVYISYSTELGTLYSHAQLKAIRAVCDKWGLPLFIDGARLGYGLASKAADVTLEQLAALSDVFYIGGTKQGALIGEAVVICNPALKKDFRYCIKQNGGLLAKGRLLGIQFLTLFENDLYFKYAYKADALAEAMTQAFVGKGYKMFTESYTNQIFPVIPNKVAERLLKEFVFEKWCELDAENTVYRICTSWATDPAQVDRLISML